MCYRRRILSGTFNCRQRTCRRAGIRWLLTRTTFPLPQPALRIKVLSSPTMEIRLYLLAVSTTPSRFSFLSWKNWFLLESFMPLLALRSTVILVPFTWTTEYDTGQVWLAAWWSFFFEQPVPFPLSWPSSPWSWSYCCFSVSVSSSSPSSAWLTRRNVDHGDLPVRHGSGHLLDLNNQKHLRHTVGLRVLWTTALLFEPHLPDISGKH